MSCLMNCHTTKDSGCGEGKKWQENLKARWRDNLSPNVPSSEKVLAIAVKNN